MTTQTIRLKFYVFRRIYFFNKYWCKSYIAQVILFDGKKYDDT